MKKQVNYSLAIQEWLHFAGLLYAKMAQAHAATVCLLQKQIAQHSERLLLFHKMTGQSALLCSLERAQLVQGHAQLVFYRQRDSHEGPSTWRPRAIAYFLSKKDYQLDEIVEIFDLSKEKLLEIYYNYFQDHFQQQEHSDPFNFSNQACHESFMQYARSKHHGLFSSQKQEQGESFQKKALLNFNSVTVQDLMVLQKQFESELQKFLSLSDKH